MNRRDFFEMATGALVGGVLAGCMPRVARLGASAASAGARSALDAAAFHATRRYARTRFGKIAYVERGTGEAALFLHGADTDRVGHGGHDLFGGEPGLSGSHVRQLARCATALW